MRFEHQLSDRREIAFAKSSGSGDRPVVFRDYMPTPAKNDIGQRVALDEEIRRRHVAKRLDVWQILFEDLNSLLALFAAGVVLARRQRVFHLRIDDNDRDFIEDERNVVDLRETCSRAASQFPLLRTRM